MSENRTYKYSIQYACSCGCVPVQSMYRSKCMNLSVTEVCLTKQNSLQIYTKTLQGCVEVGGDWPHY